MSDNIKSPILLWLWRKMDVPPEYIGLFYVSGVMFLGAILLPIGILQERYIRLKEGGGSKPLIKEMHHGK